jgi:PPOX class probable F420-dependent enzyme
MLHPRSDGVQARQNRRMPDLADAPLPDAILTALARPNPCVIAVLRSDGAPATGAVWYLWEDGEAVVTMSATGARRRGLDRDPRVSLTVLDRDSWYRQVTLQGEVVSLVDDVECIDVDRISQHYEGRPFADHESRHATARIRVDRWNQFGFLD